MGTTAKGIDYPDPSGTPARSDLQALAESVDGALSVLPDLRSGVAALTTDGTGTATITHAHGFIPTGVIVQAELGAAAVFIAPVLHGDWTASTFKVRAWAVTTGAVYVGSLSGVRYLMWR